MSLTLIQNDLRAARRRLDDLYGLMDDTFTDEIGSWSSKMAVSDAIDRIDDALRVCPTEEVAAASREQQPATEEDR